MSAKLTQTPASGPGTIDMDSIPGTAAASVRPVPQKSMKSKLLPAASETSLQAHSSQHNRPGATEAGSQFPWEYGTPNTKHKRREERRTQLLDLMDTQVWGAYEPEWKLLQIQRNNALVTEFAHVEYTERDGLLSALLKTLEPLEKVEFNQDKDRALFKALAHIKKSIMELYLSPDVDVDDFGSRFISTLILPYQQDEKEEKPAAPPTPPAAESSTLPPPAPPLDLSLLSLAPRPAKLGASAPAPPTPTLALVHRRHPASRAPMTTTAATTSSAGNSSPAASGLRTPLNRISHSSLLEHINKSSMSALKSTGIERSPGGTPCTIGKKPRQDALGIGSVLQRRFKSVSFVDSPQNNKENSASSESDFSPMATPTVQRV